MTQAQALNALLSGRSVFLTGEPGAGKTYVLNQFIRAATKRRRRVAVTASTGIAATHIGGTTIHLWSGLGTRNSLTAKGKDRLLTNEALVRQYRQTDVLVIDEVSMLHGARLDMLDEACRLLRGGSAPFGGLQVVLVGDLFQLPPVTHGDEAIDFVHQSRAWVELQPAVCYLTEQHRQQADPLLDVLVAMRAGSFRRSHIAALQARLEQEPQDAEPVIRLCTHNQDADVENKRQLEALCGERRRYVMAKRGPAFRLAQLTYGVLAPGALELAEGAAVMFVVNNPHAGYVNGTRGRVVGFRAHLPLVRLTTGRTIVVEPYSWQLPGTGREAAEVVQLPLRLGWAITIHKSQGMSLDAAVIDLRKSFTPGMGYVALSRVRSLDGIYLTGINKMAFRLYPEIVAVDQSLREASAQLERTGLGPTPTRARSMRRTTRSVQILRDSHRRWLETLAGTVRVLKLWP